MNISIFFYYILIPISWKILVINSYFPVYVIKGIQNLKNFDRIGFYIFLFYLSLLLGYTVKKEKNRGKSKTKKIEKIAFLFFLVSSITIFIYVFSFGNIITAIPKIIALRWNNEVKIPFSFLRIFNPFIMTSCYCYYFLKIQNKKINHKIFFIVTFLLSIYYLILNSGRSHFIFFLAPFFYVKYLKASIKKKLLIIIFFFVFILILILYGDDIRRIFYTMNKVIIINKLSFIEKYSKFVVQLSHPFMNLLCIKEHALEYRYGKDLLNFINLVPGISLKPLWLLNTEKFASTSGIPVDFISYGYYQFGILGIIFFSFLLGNIIQKIENYFLINKNNLIFVILNIRFVFIVVALISNFDIEVFIRGNLQFILLILYFKFMGKEK